MMPRWVRNIFLAAPLPKNNVGRWEAGTLVFCGAEANINQLGVRTETHRRPSSTDAPVDIEVTVFNVVKPPKTGIKKPNKGDHG